MELQRINFQMSVYKGYNHDNEKQRVQCDHNRQPNIHLKVHPEIITSAGFPYNLSRDRKEAANNSGHQIQLFPFDKSYILLTGERIIQPDWGSMSLSLQKNGWVTAQWMWRLRFNFPYYRGQFRGDKLRFNVEGRIISQGVILFDLPEPIHTQYHNEGKYHPHENIYVKQ